MSFKDLLSMRQTIEDPTPTPTTARPHMNQLSTDNIGIGDRVTLAKANGDTASVEVTEITGRGTLRAGEVSFAIGSGSNSWTITGVEYTMPTVPGLYVSGDIAGKFEVLRLTNDEWYLNGEGKALDDEVASDYMPMRRLVTLGDAWQEINRAIESDKTIYMASDEKYAWGRVQRKIESWVAGKR